MSQLPSDRVIVITGASSGIGAALAERFAPRPGVVLGLIGRDEERLGRVAAACRSAGATVTTASIDSRDRDALASWLESFDAINPIDCVVANAGIAAGALPGGHPERGHQMFEVFEVNLGGTLNLVVPAIALMRSRQRGRIVLLSSLSAYAPLPEAAAYSGSKAAILTFGMALRLFLKPEGIKVNVVLPGFVTTPMSRMFAGWKPLEITAADAAARIERGMQRNARTISFPWPLTTLARLVSFIPEAPLALAMRLFHLAPPQRDRT